MEMDYLKLVIFIFRCVENEMRMMSFLITN